MKKNNQNSQSAEAKNSAAKQTVVFFDENGVAAHCFQMPEKEAFELAKYAEENYETERTFWGKSKVMELELDIESTEAKNSAEENVSQMLMATIDAPIKYILHYQEIIWDRTKRENITVSKLDLCYSKYDKKKMEDDFQQYSGIWNNLTDENNTYCFGYERNADEEISSVALLTDMGNNRVLKRLIEKEELD